MTASLSLKRLGIDTYKEAVVFLRADSFVCRSEGFESQARIKVCTAEREIIATLNMVFSDLLTREQVGLSEYAWQLLGAQENQAVKLAHSRPLRTLSAVRRKIYNHPLNYEQIEAIVQDVVAGRLSDLHIAAFLAGAAADRLDLSEIVYLTAAMVKAGQRIHWESTMIVDKHCVGGVPGNRTSPIIVAIVAAFGLIIPKTSSRAITSPAGTADTMEVFTHVDIDLNTIRKVIAAEGGCLAWGGTMNLSPADDILIRVERALNIDVEGQLVASVLSKKVAVGSTHVVIDIPVGPTAKVRNLDTAHLLKHYLIAVGSEMGLDVKVMITDGAQPIGIGIGPAMEARDIMAVLQNQADAPQDLRERGLKLAGAVLEFSPLVAVGAGRKLAEDILTSGRAWQKFQAICRAQGGFYEPPPLAPYQHVYVASNSGMVESMDNRYLARIATLAGAPRSKAAGIQLHAKVGSWVVNGQPLFTLFSESQGELNYALDLLTELPKVITLVEK